MKRTDSEFDAHIRTGGERYSLQEVFSSNNGTSSEALANIEGVCEELIARGTGVVTVNEASGEPDDPFAFYTREGVSGREVARFFGGLRLAYPEVFGDDAEKVLSPDQIGICTGYILAVTDPDTIPHAI